MKKKRNAKENDDLQAEYDLSKLKGSVRRKHAEQFAAGTNLVILSPENAKAFPTSEAVNKALAKLIQPAQKRGELKQSERSTTPSQVSYSFRPPRRIEG